MMNKNSIQKNEQQMNFLYYSGNKNPTKKMEIRLFITCMVRALNTNIMMLNRQYRLETKQQQEQSRW